MYRKFYGLSEDPFQLNTDPRFFYMSRHHHEAYAHMNYALNASKAFTVITGEVGTGKTSLIQLMLAQDQGRTRTVHLFNPKLSTRDLLKYICHNLGLKTEGLTKGDLLMLLCNFLLKCYALGERVVLIIDDAQALSPTLLEEVRLLTNLETPQSKLLQVILMGQPELDKVMSDPRYRALRQRISVQYHLNPLNRNETKEYIEHRLKVAGSRGARIFKPAAVRLIWKFSQGIPRVINILCDNALVIGYSTSRKVIDGQIAKEALRDMGYLRPKTDTFFRRPTFRYGASGVLLGIILGLGAIMVLNRYQDVPPVTAVENAVEPETTAVKKERALAALAQQRYGFVNPTVLDILLEHNPHITDLNRLPTDEPINAPPLTDELFLGMDPDGRYHIYLGTFDDQRSIETLWNHPLLQARTLKMGLRRVSSNILWYRLTASGFQSREDAMQVLRTLKQQGVLPAFAASR